VVGAGLSGAVVARELADFGYWVDVIELRDHIGGNCFDFIDENGIRVHRYGPHIFHTNNKRVFDWLSRYTEWIDYEHKVLAELPCGQRVPFPPNNKTLESVDENDLIDIFYAPYTKKNVGSTHRGGKPKNTIEGPCSTGW
jgi:UDP-galactopyranose mutase